MGRSSFVNAFRLLRQKPQLLLLLLPVPVVSALAAKLLAMPLGMTDANFIDPMEMMSQVLLPVILQYAILLGANLLAGFLLMPPAMELLHEGAAGEDAPAGWWVRGMRLHWWKPVALGAIKWTIFLIGYFILSFLLSFVMVFAMAGAVAGSMSGDIDMTGSGSMTLIMIVILILTLLVISVLYLIFTGIFLFLMPATADRGFGEAFRAVFGRRGLKRLLKLMGVELLLIIVASLPALIFGFCHVLLSGMPLDTADSITAAVAAFSQSWTQFFVSLLASTVLLFHYPYSFCVFQEIVREEDAEMKRLLEPQ